MKNELKIRNFNIDNNKLYFCATILEDDIRSAITQAESFLEQGVDMLEIRGDLLVQTIKDNKDTPSHFRRDVSVLRMIKHIREVAGDMPIFFTIRSKKEGGAFAGTSEEYMDLIEPVIDDGTVDAIDLEMDMMEYNEEKIIDYIHRNGIKVILSKHIVGERPFEERIKEAGEVLKHQEKSGADICKLAFYVENEEQLKEYQKLLVRYEDWMKRPHIGIAMGEAGIVSRYQKEWCNTCISFVCGEKVAAPGQLTMEGIKRLCYNS